MNGLQEAFYIIGIVFMSLMLILVLVLITAVFVIRAKIVNIERQVQARIEEVTNIAAKGGEIAAKVGTKIAGVAANKVRKTARRAR
jgi:predicted Holliday junction resolvase-like endonuclease